ncbi:MAG TPA: signal peptidase I [Verrucomicrobiae bacterium]|jgi:signal peptidase I
MTNENQNQTESNKMYRPWVGVLLSLFLSGASQFLAGKRIQGIAWFVGLPLLAIIGAWYLASPIAPGNLPGFTLLAASIVLWIVMLVKSYRPIPHLRWFGWIGFICLFLLLYEASDFDFVRPFKMPTNSMSPTLQGNTKRADGTTIFGDKVMVEEYAYWFSRPQRGDIIVFKTDGTSSMLPQNEFFAKRIAGIPGDVLSIQGERLYNHGQIISQPTGLADLKFIPPIASPVYLANSSSAYKVPDGSYFVVGDNTTNSLDSRYFGVISEKNIIGRISKIYWPLQRAGKIQ